MLTSASLLVHIKVGGDGISVENQPDFVKKIFYAMPFISIPVMCQVKCIEKTLQNTYLHFCIFKQFPAALNVYWFTSNLFTITSSRIIGMESVSKMLKIGKINPAAQVRRVLTLLLCTFWKIMFYHSRQLKRSNGVICFKIPWHQINSQVKCKWE